MHLLVENAFDLAIMWGDYPPQTSLYRGYVHPMVGRFITVQCASAKLDSTSFIFIFKLQLREKLTLLFLCHGMKKLGKDQIRECLSSPLANLRILQVDTVKLHHSELVMLDYLLHSTPALEIMEFLQWEKYKEFEMLERMYYIIFLEKYCFHWGEIQHKWE